MAETLGKIEKLDIEQYGCATIRGASCFTGSELPQDYQEIAESYWREVNEQLANQESKVGTIKRIYHESVSIGGEEGLKVIEKVNALSYLIARDQI